MGTDRLYNDSAYIKEFEARIIEVQPFEDKFGIVLDRTAFYPEGGGQPSDTGYLNKIHVLQVIEKDGKVFHIVDTNPSKKEVTGSINWKRRFDFMQQHTGQHILSACFEELFNGRTDSFHMGRDIVSIEINIDSFSAEDAVKIENMSNNIIYNNLPVTAKVVTSEELKSIPLRKMPKVTENIRIVEVKSIDYSPCGGTHVCATGEVGIIKIKSWEKCKGGIRFIFVCGYRALMDYSLQNSIIRAVCEKLSVKDSDIIDTIGRTISDLKSTEKQLSIATQELIKSEADNILREYPLIDGKRIIKIIFEGRSINDIKLLAQYLTQVPGTIALLACRNESVQAIFTRSEDVNIDMNSLFKSVLNIIDGKGGGNTRTAQGGGSRVDGLDDFLGSAQNNISFKI